MRQLSFLATIVAIITLMGCRDDQYLIEPEVIPPTDSYTNTSANKGLYVLCEGNMGANKATLDYLDMNSGTYSLNIYPARNPGKVMELGDVGNDIKAYGSRLWIVVNQSNRVEVAHASTAVSIGSVDVPNARYLAFDGGYAYVSSYVGPVNGKSVLGEVYKIDTLSLKVVGRCTVGYQPEEMEVMNGKLYVANSGGYSALQGMGYDRSVSVIDLASFLVEHTIDIAPNLFRIRKDKHGSLWVVARGDYADIPSRIYEVFGNQVVDSIDVRANDIAFRGDSLIFMNDNGCGVFDLKSRRIITSQFLQKDTDRQPKTPYGLIVDPSNGLIYVMDATNYVSSGKLFCYDGHGKQLWWRPTGDIPGHACLVADGPNLTEDSGTPAPSSAYIQAVDEYVPAPGQFVNVLPLADSDDNADSLVAKCTAALAGKMGGMVTLGGYGGYITFHFDHPVRNVKGEYDLLIRGNYITGASEPGIVMVAQDTNGNGIPDDTWYELRGSADEDHAENVVYGYQITYHPAPMQDIPWTDNQGAEGVISRNGYHTQEYYPLWIHTPLTFTGTLLPPNGNNQGQNGNNGSWFLDSFRYGYVDNGNTDEQCSFDIGWAVDSQRRPVSLTHIDFVRVYSAMNQQCGWLGETSTELCGAKDLHY